MDNSRITRLTASMADHNLDAVAIVPGANMRYLTSLAFHTFERLTLALFPASGGVPCLVLPAMELGRVQTSAGLALHYFPWSDAEGPRDALRSAIEAVFSESEARPTTPTVGIEYTTMRVMELRALEQSAGSFTAIHTTDATALLAKLRMVKDETELAAMIEAAHIIEMALQAAIARIKPGVTERQLAAIWIDEMTAAGAEGQCFDCIVASGPNSANPHHTISDRPFQPGDLIILDGGVLYHGYASDITRTVALGEPGPVARRIYNLVLAANTAARAAIYPGVDGEYIDQAARAVISDGGYGDYFIHRTGHGLGLECHEPPYIVAGSHTPLAVGTTFTIEPGIYIEGTGGVRIEDDVVVTEDGCTSLTTFNRELVIVPV